MNNTSPPLISVVTVCMNSAHTLQNTINSLLNQSFNNFEYIIIDGGSSDATLEILRKTQLLFQSRSIPFQWVSEKDNGIYDAMNKGIARCNGRYIALLNSDDWYEPNTLQIVANAIANHPNITVFHGLVRFLKSGLTHTVYGASHNFTDSGTFPHHATCFIASSAYRLAGPYNLNYKISADYEMMLRLKKLGNTFHLIEQVLTNFSLHGISSSKPLSTDIIAIQYQYRLIKKHRFIILNIIYRIINRIYPLLK